MKYGFVSRRNKETIKRHIEALKPYNLDEIIIDNFEEDVIIQLEKLEAGDSLYIEEPPRNTTKFVKIHSYTRKNGISLYINGTLVDNTPFMEMFELYTKLETAKRIGYTE